MTVSKNITTSKSSVRGTVSGTDGLCLPAKDGADSDNCAGSLLTHMWDYGSSQIGSAEELGLQLNYPAVVAAARSVLLVDITQESS